MATAPAPFVPLHCSVVAVRRLLGMGAGCVVNAATPLGSTALELACAAGSAECAKLLLAAGASAASAEAWTDSAAKSVLNEALRSL
jgi:ankyrin repeat protein